MSPNEFGNSPFYLTPAQKQKLLEYRKAREAENVNYLTEIPKQLVGGFIQGFTTLNPIDEPTDVVGGLARSIGSLMGFVGYIPAPGILGKLGMSKVLKASGLSKALGWERRIGPSLMEGKAFIPVPSIPMQVADKIVGLGEGFITSNKAAQAAIKMLGANTMIGDVVKGGLHLGVASAVGSAQPWELHVKERMEGFVSGFSLGAFNRVMGNLVQTDGTLDFSKTFTGTEITSKLGRDKVNAIARMIAGGVYMGLPSTLEGMPFPLQVYEYVLGGYFGYKETDMHHRSASAYLRKKATLPSAIFARTEDAEYKGLTEKAREIVDHDADMMFGKLLNDPVVGEITTPAIHAYRAVIRTFEQKAKEAKSDEERATYEAQAALMGISLERQTKLGLNFAKAVKDSAISRFNSYKAQGMSEEDAFQEAQKDLGHEIVSTFTPTSYNTTVSQFFGKKQTPRGRQFMGISKQVGKSVAEFMSEYEVPVKFHQTTAYVMDKLMTIPELQSNRDVVEQDLGKLLKKHSAGYGALDWDATLAFNKFMKEFTDTFVKGKKTISGEDFKLRDEDIRNAKKMWKYASQNKERQEIRYNTKVGHLKKTDEATDIFDADGKLPQGDMSKPLYWPNRMDAHGEYDVSYGASSFLEDALRQFHTTKNGGALGKYEDNGLNIDLKYTESGKPILEWMSEGGDVEFEKKVARVFNDLANQLFVPLGGVKTKGPIKVTKPVLDNISEVNHYYERVERWMAEKDKQGYEEFKADRQKFIQYVTEAGTTPQRAAMNWRRIHANNARVLEILNGNMNGEGKSFEAIMNNKAFLHSADKINKYFQVLDDPSLSLSDRVFQSVPDADPVYGFLPGKSGQTVLYNQLRYIILKAQNTANPATTEKGSPTEWIIDKDTKLPKEVQPKVLRDGGVYVRSDVFKKILEEFGLDPNSGMFKGVLFDNSNAQLGALIGKQAFHRVSRELDNWMWKNNQHFIMFDTTTKQAGERQMHEATWDATRGEGNEFIFDGDPNLKPATYLLPTRALKVNVGSSEHYTDNLEDTRIKTAFYMNLQNPENIQWLDDNFYKLPFVPNKEWDDFTKAYYKDRSLQYDAKKFHPDNLSLQQILDAVSGRTPVPEEFLRKLVNEIFDKSVDTSIYQEKEDPVEEKVFLDDPRFKVPARRLLEVATRFNPLVLQMKGVWKYLEGALKNYIRTRTYYPLAPESMTVTLTPIEHRFQHLVKEGEFLLTKGAAQKKIYNPVTKAWETIEEVFHSYEKEKNTKKKQMLWQKLSAISQRVPTDSTSGMRVLTLGGIIDRPGAGAYYHPKDMYYMGGADMDGDKAFIYWGMPAGIKNEIYNERNKYSDFSTGHEIFPEAAAPWAARFSETDERFVKHQREVHTLNMFERMKSALWGYEGQQNVGSQVNTHERYALLADTYPNGRARNISTESGGAAMEKFISTRLRQNGGREITVDDDLIEVTHYQDRKTRVEPSKRDVLGSTVDVTSKGVPVMSRTDLLNATKEQLRPTYEYFIKRKDGKMERVDDNIVKEYKQQQKNRYDDTDKTLFLLSNIKNAAFRGQQTVKKQGERKLEKVSLAEAVSIARTNINHLPMEMQDTEKAPSISMRVAGRFARLNFDYLREMIAPVNKVNEQNARNAMNNWFKLFGTGRESVTELAKLKKLAEEEGRSGIKLTPDTVNSLMQEVVWQSMVNVQNMPDYLNEKYEAGELSLEKAADIYRELVSNDYADMSSFFTLRDYGIRFAESIWEKIKPKDVDPDTLMAAEQWDLFHEIKAITREVRQLADAHSRLIAAKNMLPEDVKKRGISKEFVLESGKVDYEHVQDVIQKAQNQFKRTYGQEGKDFYDASLISSIHAQVNPNDPKGHMKLQRINELLEPYEKPMRSLENEVKGLIGEINDKKKVFTKGGELAKLEGLYGAEATIDFHHSQREDRGNVPWELESKITTDVLNESASARAKRLAEFHSKANDLMLAAEKKFYAWKEQETIRDEKKKAFFASNFIPETIVQPLVSDGVLKTFMHYYGEIGDVITGEGKDVIKRMAEMIGMDPKFSIDVKRSIPAAIDGTANYIDDVPLGRKMAQQVKSGVAMFIEKIKGDVGYQLPRTAKDWDKIASTKIEEVKELKELEDRLFNVLIKHPQLLSQFEQYIAGNSGGVFGGETARTLSIPGLRRFIDTVESFPSSRFPIQAADYFRWLSDVGLEHRQHGDKVMATIKSFPVWHKDKLEMEPVTKFFSHMELTEMVAIEMANRASQNDAAMNAYFKSELKRMRTRPQNNPDGTPGEDRKDRTDTIDIDHPAFDGDFRKVWSIVARMRRKDLGTYLDADGKVQKLHPEDDAYLKEAKAAEKEWKELFQDGAKEYRVPEGGREVRITAANLRERATFIMERMIKAINANMNGRPDLYKKYVKTLTANTEFIDSAKTVGGILNELLNKGSIPNFDMNTTGAILHALYVDGRDVKARTPAGWEKTGQKIGQLPEAARAQYLRNMAANPKTQWVVWEKLPMHDLATWYPARSFSEDNIKKTMVRRMQKKLGMDAPFNPSTATADEIKIKQWAEQEVLPDKGLASHILRDHEVAAQKPEDITTNLVSSRRLRELFHVPGEIPIPDTDMSPEALLDNLKSMNKLRSNLIVEALHHQIRLDYLAKLPAGEDTQAWANFMEMYTRQVIGAPSYVPKEWFDDPKMHLKKNAHWFFTDQYVADKMNKIGMMSFNGRPFFEVQNHAMEDMGVPIGAMTPEGIKARLASGMIEKKAVVDQRIGEATHLMMKTNAAALLFHPRGFVNNVFGGAFMTYITTGAGPMINARNMNYLRQNLRVLRPTKTLTGKAGAKEEMMEVRTWADVREIVAEYGGIESFINEEVLAGSGLGTKQIKEALNEFNDLWKSDPHLKKLDAWKSIAKKYGITDAIFEVAMLPMRTSERINRETAWLAHYFNARNVMGIHHAKDFELMHPWLVQMANRGVRMTQFLYNNAARPQFAATNLGRMFSQFQLWAWNSVRLNLQIAREAQYTGYKPGTPEYESFRRLATANAFVLGLSVLFPSSMFEATLPAPWNWFRDLSAWIFGDEKDKESAFYGAMPYPLNILQMVAPPSSRYLTDVFNVIVGGGEAMDKFLNYKIWTWFPFGRAMRDTASLLENPVMVVEKTTGFPLHQLQKDIQAQKRNPFTTGGSIMAFLASSDYSEPIEEEMEKP